MSTTRRAVVSVEMVTIQCPKCDNPLEEPRTGSYYWSAADIHSDEQITCRTCRLVLTLPRRLAFDFLGA